MAALDLDEPAGPFRVFGLDDEQLALARARFGPRARAPSGVPRGEIHVRRSGVRRAPLARAEWTFDIHADAAGVDAVADGVRLRIERDPLRATAVVDDDDDVLSGVANAARWLMAYAALADGGVLLHSAGILEPDGGAWLLVAPSGTGKSTLCQRHEGAALGVLSDDLNVAWPASGRAEGASRPLAPGPRAAAPLRGVGALRRGEVSVRDSSGPQMLAQLIAAAPFVNADPWLLDTCLERCAELLARTRTIEVRMSLDEGAHKAALSALSSL